MWLDFIFFGFMKWWLEEKGYIDEVEERSYRFDYLYKYLVVFCLFFLKKIGVRVFIFVVIIFEGVYRERVEVL